MKRNAVLAKNKKDETQKPEEKVVEISPEKGVPTPKDKEPIQLLTADQLEKILNGSTTCPNETTEYFKDQIIKGRAEFGNQYKVYQSLTEKKTALENELTGVTKNLDNLNSRLSGLIYDLSTWFKKSEKPQ